MTGSIRAIGLALGVWTMCWVLPAAAQDILDRGKTGAQLFASDCALCHKSPQGLAKSGGLFGLSSFLRQHYTASRESAGAIAAYLDAMDKAAPPPKRTPVKRTAKGDDKGKPGDKKPNAASDGEKPDAKASDSKPAEAKPAETKPAEPAPAPPKAE